MLLRSFKVSSPPTEVRPPAWDLSLVLVSLKRAPYKPLSAASERFVGLKALFLLALASSKRVGELHGLSYRVFHTRGWKEMSLGFVPCLRPRLRTRLLLIPSLRDFPSQLSLAKDTARRLDSCARSER